MIDWIEWAGVNPPHPDALVEVEYQDSPLHETKRAIDVDWFAEGATAVTRYRVRMPASYYFGDTDQTRADDRQEAGTHYRDMAVQPWAAMQSWMTPEQFAGYLRGCALKYLARAGSKGPTLDEYRKARHYLDKLIETMEQA